MNDDRDFLRDLSHELTALVAATAGVVDVYSPSPHKLRTPSRILPAALTQVVENAVVNAADAAAKVAVDRANSGQLTVSATIGVGDGHTVLDTVRRVADALRVHLESIALGDVASPEPAIITVRVSRVDAAVTPSP